MTPSHEQSHRNANKSIRSYAETHEHTCTHTQGKWASGGGVSLGRYKVWCRLQHLKNVRVRSIYLKGGFPDSMSVSLFRSRSGEQIELPKSYFRECPKIREKKIHAFSGLVSAYLFLFRSGEQIKWAGSRLNGLKLYFWESRRIRHHQKISGPFWFLDSKVCFVAKKNVYRYTIQKNKTWNSWNKLTYDQ